MSFHTDDKPLKALAVQRLGVLLNVENVVAVLVGAHAAGEKEVCLELKKERKKRKEGRKEG
jgi:hypothetical protein